MAKKPNITTGLEEQPKKTVVYSADNIAKSATAKAPDYAKMSVDKLGQTIAKARNKAELNQVKIMNQPISMGVITGQAAHMAAINNAQINSLTGIYDAKNDELTRKAAEEQQVFENDLAMKNYDLNRQNTLSTIAERGKPKPEEALATYGAGLTRGEGGSVDFAAYQRAKDEAVKSGVGITGTDFDNRYSSMLSSDDIKKFNIGITPAQQVALQQDQATAAAKQQEIDQEKMATVPKLEQKVSSIDSLINDEYLSKAVGPNMFARNTGLGTDLKSMLTGGQKNFVAGVQNIISQETLDTLVALKAQGGTLGALSDQERVMLQQAATKIGNWEIKDRKGNVIGYAVDENNFRKELQKVKDSTNRLLSAARGSGVNSSDPLGLGI